MFDDCTGVHGGGNGAQVVENICGSPLPSMAVEAMEWFQSRVEAKVVTEDSHRLNNEFRPHSRPGKMMLGAFPRILGDSPTLDPSPRMDWFEEHTKGRG